MLTICLKEGKLKNTWNKRLKTYWKGWGCQVLIIVIVVTSFRSAIAEMTKVDTGSMKPTIVEGDRFFVNKLAYDLKIPYTTLHITEWSPPQRGDIVIFNSPIENKRLVKRVIGIPGDSIEMHNNQLIINGEKVTYEPVDHIRDSLQLLNKDFAQYGVIENLRGKRHPVQFIPRPGAITSFSLKSIPDGKYFMMGDNRNNSLDSRVFEFVDRNQIIGKATSVFYSVDINNDYKPRWERFFTKLP